MIESLNTRYILWGCWIIAFIILWGGLQIYLPDKILLNNLNNIERAISDKNWNLANKRLNNLKQNWQDNKLAIQISNGTAEVYEFEKALGHLKILVKHKNNHSLVYLGLLKEITKNLTDVFPGP